MFARLRLGGLSPPGGAYLLGGNPSSGRGASRCGCGIGGAGLWGTWLDEPAPGGFGAGRIGRRLLPLGCGLINGLFRPSPGDCPPGTGGGARGFSKLSPSFFGNRGLDGGLSTCCCCPYPPGLKLVCGVSCIGLLFSGRALSNLWKVQSSLPFSLLFSLKNVTTSMIACGFFFCSCSVMPLACSVRCHSLGRP